MEEEAVSVAAVLVAMMVALGVVELAAVLLVERVPWRIVLGSSSNSSIRGSNVCNSSGGGGKVRISHSLYIACALKYCNVLTTFVLTCSHSYPKSCHTPHPPTQIKATPVKIFVLHLDLLTRDHIVHRVTISNMWEGSELKVRGAGTSLEKAAWVVGDEGWKCVAR